MFKQWRHIFTTLILHDYSLNGRIFNLNKVIAFLIYRSHYYLLKSSLWGKRKLATCYISNTQSLQKQYRVPLNIWWTTMLNISTTSPNNTLSDNSTLSDSKTLSNSNTLSDNNIVSLIFRHSQPKIIEQYSGYHNSYIIHIGARSTFHTGHPIYDRSKISIL